MEGQNISTFFEKDHNRLDHLFQFFRLNKQSDFLKAKQSFRDFLRGLERHIRWEEELLFPIFEARTGMKDSGPTAVMRFEHEQIKKALNTIHEKVKSNKTDSDDAESLLLEILTQHNCKEEGILYPAIDQLLSGNEKKSVFEEIEKISAEKEPSCCGMHGSD